jgi:xanthine dehydrogenase accessory factor
MIRELLPTLVTTIEAGRPVAVCRLVETRGSTPQKAGATMLVFADGSQAGTLGGGCVEAEVKRKALAAIDEKTVVVEQFQLDDDYGWDDGLICGGRMQVLIDSLASAASRTYYAKLHQLLEVGEGAIEAIVFATNANHFAAPACYVFDSSQSVVAACGKPDDVAASGIIKKLPALAARPRASAEEGIAFLPSLPRCRLLIVGAGHVGQAVARLAADLDFIVWVVDDRAEYVTEKRFPFAERRIAGTIGEVLPTIEITPRTYCLIVTRGHNHDEEALYHLADRGASYVGMIGSKRKIRLIFDDLLAEGISAEALSKVHAPVGLAIGSQTVPEIAISIVAQLIAHRNQPSSS